jgi:hypothetical protein
MSRDLLEYIKWILYEEDYFISASGFLIYSYPRSKRHFVKEYERACGFRWFLPDNDNTSVKYFDKGKSIKLIPRDIVPIRSWEVNN